MMPAVSTHNVMQSSETLYEESYCVHSYITGRCHAGTRRPTEDPTGNFTLGGWLFDFGDAGMDLSASGFDGKDRELVLGRKTYEIFEACWPYQSEDNPIARTLNAAKKHVASRTLSHCNGTIRRS